MTQRRIVLIDGSSLAFRAFYSILDLERFVNKSGLHTNALYSFNRMLDNILTQFEPSHILVAFDKSNVTFRTQMFADYKGGRAKTPSEFKEQMPYFRVLLDAYGIKHYDLDNYEADDIIGSLAGQADATDQVAVISGDRDLIQLARDNVTVYINKKGISDLEAVTPASLLEEFGIKPDQVVEVMGLRGDPSDNIPGVDLVGQKKALKFIQDYGSIDGLYEHIDDLKPSKTKDNLINQEDRARMSRELAQIDQDAPLEIGLDDIKLQDRDVEALVDFYRLMDFNSYLSDLVAEAGDLQEEPHDYLADYEIHYLETITGDHLPDQAAYYTEVLDKAYQVNPVEAVAWTDLASKQAYWTRPETAFNSQIFKDWLANAGKEKIVLDSKREQVIAAKQGLEIKGIIYDCLIANYLIDTHNSNEIADMLAQAQLPDFVKRDDLVYGKGKKRALPEDSDQLGQHLASKVIALPLLVDPLNQALEEAGMTQLYEEIERPVADVLAKMEFAGVKVDRQILEEKNEELIERVQEIEDRIHDLAGEDFNVNSPKQLGEILFEKLGLPVIKKTKTGYSTAADVLEKLQGQHPIIDELLEYRQLSKLQSTYLASLPSYVQEDGKIHTHFDQTLTQTGRLSSYDPNLQNIPVRLEEGRRIRQAFVPSKEGWQLFAADYSQIELRVLAHIADDEHMKEAFAKKQDIHEATARRVFGLSEDQEVDGNTRRNAKAVNFGIVYGISDYGLSQNLNISRKQAKEFIDTYFEQFPAIAQYMERVVEEAKESGYVSTLFGRRRYLPDLKSSNFNLRSFAERTAINSPIQGTAADIIKIAMIKLDQTLVEQGLESRLILQVHDELILEGPQEEMGLLHKLVPEVMEQAVDLSVPLLVEASQGDNWYQL